MKNKVTTTVGGFPVHNITTNGRKQSDILKEEPEKVLYDGGVSERVLADTFIPNTGEVPKVVTLERAIKYFEQLAEKENPLFNLKVSIWLRELLTSNGSGSSKSEVETVINKVEEDDQTGITEVTVDFSNPDVE